MTSGPAVDAPACAVGRLAPEGAWVGFVPTLEDGYALVISSASGTRRSPAGVDDLVALALAYFEDQLDPPPDELAATHGDIAAIVRHAAHRRAEGPMRAALQQAVDAIDDGLAVDVVVERLANAFGAGGDPIGHLRRRAAEAVSG